VGPRNVRLEGGQVDPVNGGIVCVAVALDGLEPSVGDASEMVEDDVVGGEGREVRAQLGAHRGERRAVVERQLPKAGPAELDVPSLGAPEARDVKKDVLSE